jgi:hypothetical protein
MEKDIRALYSDFSTQATRHLYSVFNEFSNAADAIETDEYENIFQQTRAKYTARLKSLLEKSAETIIGNCNSAETIGRLRINFTESISYHLKEFTRKSGLL